MATRERYLEAIERAEAAGDTEAADLLRSQMPPEPAAEQTGSYSPLAIGGELAAAANRNVMDTLDFLGPGTANAALRLMGVDYQLPEFGQAWREYAPGGEGEFMPEGTARDVVQGLGATIPAAGSLYSVPGRTLATNREVAEEVLGFGSTPGLATGEAAADQVDSLLLAGRDVPPQPMAARADQAGFPISPGDRYGTRALRYVDAMIDSTWMPGNPIHRQADKRQAMMNRAAAESLGLHPSTRLTDDVVGDVARELSGEFNRLTDLEGLPATEEFVDSLLTSQATAKSRIFTDPDVSRVINEVFDRIDDQGNMSVTDYQDISSELKAKIRQAWRGESPDPFFAETLGEIVDALDNLAIESTSPHDMNRLRDARRKWKALSQLEKSRAIGESGDVSGRLLGNYLRRTDKGGYGRGGNRTPLYETARLTKAFPETANSMTATRNIGNELMSRPMGFITRTALSPLVSSAANAYYYGTQAPFLGPVRRASVSPGLTTRAGALFEDDEDELER